MIEIIVISVASILTMIITKFVIKKSTCKSECCDITLQTEPNE